MLLVIRTEILIQLHTIRFVNCVKIKIPDKFDFIRDFYFQEMFNFFLQPSQWPDQCVQ